MRVTIVNGSLGGGGAERNLAWLANSLVETGHPVTVLTLDGADPFFELHPAVAHRALDVESKSRSTFEAISSNLKRIAGIRRAVKESNPDVVLGFCFQANIQTVLACAGTGLPVMIAERTDPLLLRLPKAWMKLHQAVYPWAKAIVCQSRAVLERDKKLIRGKSFVIPNPVRTPEPDLVPAPKTRKRLISVARMHPVKQLDVLIRVFARLAPDFPEWELVLVGAGVLFEDLKQLSVDLGLDGRVVFTGALKNPFPMVKSADLFALTSEREGLPNSLAEAMAHGVPAVSFDCPSGPAELIRDGVDGLLVPPNDTTALENALRQLMGNDEERARFAASAAQIVDRFKPSDILNLWIEALKSLTASPERSTSRAANVAPAHERK